VKISLEKLQLILLLLEKHVVGKKYLVGNYYYNLTINKGSLFTHPPTSKSLYGMIDWFSNEYIILKAAKINKIYASK